MTTNGPDALDNNFIHFATLTAIFSGLFNATLFGTSSPTTKDKYVVIITTTIVLTISLYGIYGDIMAFNGSDNVAPPKAPVNIPISVIPI